MTRPLVVNHLGYDSFGQRWSNCHCRDCCASWHGGKTSFWHRLRYWSGWYRIG